MLYLVATPIGNLGDITIRALDTLRAVDVVVCEDTSKTGLMLHHFEIKKPMISCNQRNERHAIERVISMLAEGRNVAVVTDAGTPGISDPGYLLVRRCLEAEYEFTMIPGASGCIMALALSGLPGHSFTFRGFPPKKPGPRRRFFDEDSHSGHTLIFYESPFRVVASLRNAFEVYGDRQAAIANDLTKKFELMVRGSLSDLIVWAEKTTLKGEFIYVISGLSKKRHMDEDDLENE